MGWDWAGSMGLGAFPARTDGEGGLGHCCFPFAFRCRLGDYTGFQGDLPGFFHWTPSGCGSVNSLLINKASFLLLGGGSGLLVVRSWWGRRGATLVAFELLSGAGCLFSFSSQRFFYSSGNFIHRFIHVFILNPA